MENQALHEAPGPGLGPGDPQVLENVEVLEDIENTNDAPGEVDRYRAGDQLLWGFVLSVDFRTSDLLGAFMVWLLWGSHSKPFLLPLRGQVDVIKKHRNEAGVDRSTTWGAAAIIVYLAVHIEMDTHYLQELGCWQYAGRILFGLVATLAVSLGSTLVYELCGGAWNSLWCEAHHRFYVWLDHQMDLIQARYAPMTGVSKLRIDAITELARNMVLPLQLVADLAAGLAGRHTWTAIAATLLSPFATGLVMLKVLLTVCGCMAWRQGRGSYVWGGIAGAFIICLHPCYSSLASMHLVAGTLEDTSQLPSWEFWFQMGLQLTISCQTIVASLLLWWIYMDQAYVEPRSAEDMEARRQRQLRLGIAYGTVRATALHLMDCTTHQAVCVLIPRIVQLLEPISCHWKPKSLWRLRLGSCALRDLLLERMVAVVLTVVMEWLASKVCRWLTTRLADWWGRRAVSLCTGWTEAAVREFGASQASIIENDLAVQGVWRPAMVLMLGTGSRWPHRRRFDWLI